MNKTDMSPTFLDLLLECTSLWQCVSRLALRPTPQRLLWCMLEIWIPGPTPDPSKQQLPGMEPWNLHFFKLPRGFLCYKLKFKSYCSKEWGTAADEVLPPPSSLALERGQTFSCWWDPLRMFSPGTPCLLGPRGWKLFGSWIWGHPESSHSNTRPPGPPIVCQNCFLCAQVWSSFKIRYSQAWLGNKQWLVISTLR